MGFPAVGKGGSRGPMTVTLETATGETTDVTCRLLVAADGGNSKVKEEAFCFRGPLGGGGVRREVEGN